MSDHGFASLGPSLLARKGGARPAMRPQLPPPESSEREIAALADEQLEDLGWNDMGDSGESGEGGDASAARRPGAEVVSITQNPDDVPSAPVSPIVRRQQKSLEQRLLGEAVMPGGGKAESGAESGAETGAGSGAEQDSVATESAAAGDAAAAAAPAVSPTTANGAACASLTPVTEPAAPPPAPRRVAAHRRPAAAATASIARRAAFTLRLDSDRHLKLRLTATMQGVSAQALLTEALDAMLADIDDLDAIAARLRRH